MCQRHGHREWRTRQLGQNLQLCVAWPLWPRAHPPLRALRGPIAWPYRPAKTPRPPGLGRNGTKAHQPPPDRLLKFPHARRDLPKAGPDPLRSPLPRRAARSIPLSPSHLAKCARPCGARRVAQSVQKSLCARPGPYGLTDASKFQNCSAIPHAPPNPNSEGQSPAPPHRWPHRSAPGHLAWPARHESVPPGSIPPKG